jgi:hypothetical protein
MEIDILKVKCVNDMLSNNGVYENSVAHKEFSKELVSKKVLQVR